METMKTKNRIKESAIIDLAIDIKMLKNIKSFAEAHTKEALLQYIQKYINEAEEQKANMVEEYYNGN